MDEQNEKNKTKGSSKRKIIIRIVIAFVLLLIAFNVIQYMLNTDSLTP